MTPSPAMPDPTLRYPRRRLIRALLRLLAGGALRTLTRWYVEGREHLPPDGPLLVVGNHFSFIDPVAMIHATPWPLEFIGGLEMPNAPPIVRFIPRLWGRYTVQRGTGARDALRSAQTVIEQGGILGIFPEGGSWADVLRPARPGAAYLAAQTCAPLLPIGFDGLVDVFPSLRRGRRAHVTVRIGPRFGPYTAAGRGRARRRQLDAIGDRIMRHIAALLPPQRRGHYSDDPAIRAAAQGTEIYPWDDLTEG
jgi:1-acyl-sn-glycerol-3-phosphate acyltransferase